MNPNKTHTMNQTKKFSLKTKLIVGFVFIILAVGTAVLVAIQSMNHLVSVTRELDHSYIVTRELARLRADNTRVRALLLEVTDPGLENRQEYLDELDLLLHLVQEEFSNIEMAVADDPHAFSMISDIKNLALESERIRLRQIDLVNEGSFDEAIELFRGTSYDLYESVHRKIVDLGFYLDDQNELMQEQANLVAVRSNISLMMIGVVVLLLILAVAAGMLRMISRIARDVKEGVAVLGNAVSEIQTTVAEISTGATETATAISETTTTVEEIRQTAMVASGKAKNLLMSSQKATEVGERGFESSQQMVESMQKIDVQMKAMHETITKLSEQNRSIGEITSTVSDIADQSNLLAVNAAIEAAKAGEHGRGFSVVAQEIRTLAEQSKRSTAQVRDILHDIQSLVSKAVEVINQSKETVDEGSSMVKEDRIVVELLVDSINEAMDAAVQISSSSQQQMAGMDQIVPAMENIRQASEQNLTGIKQTQDAAKSLHELGLNLKKIVDHYRL